MFDIGFWELLVIAVIGLVVLGPERLPGAIRSVQRTLAKVRAFGSKMEAEINHELRVKELHEHLKQIEAAEDLDKLSPELKRSLKELQDAAASVQRPYATTSDVTGPTSDDATDVVDANNTPAATNKPVNKSPEDNRE